MDKSTLYLIKQLHSTLEHWQPLAVTLAMASIGRLRDNVEATETVQMEFGVTVVLHAAVSYY